MRGICVWSDTNASNWMDKCHSTYPSIQSFIHPFSLCAYGALRVSGDSADVPSVFRRRRSYALDESAACRRAAKKEKQPFTLALTPSASSVTRHSSPNIWGLVLK